jgi:hypothetical protein
MDTQTKYFAESIAEGRRLIKALELAVNTLAWFSHEFAGAAEGALADQSLKRISAIIKPEPKD